MNDTGRFKDSTSADADAGLAPPEAVELTAGCLDLVAGPCLIGDRTGTVVFCSQAAARMLGCAPADLIGRPLPSLLDLAGERWSETASESCAGEQVRQIAMSRADGSRFLAELRTGWFESRGRRFLAAMLRDLSDAVRRERQIAQLGRIIEDSSGEIFVVDGTTWRFLLVNRKARENLGYTAEALANMTLIDIKPAFTRERFAQLAAPLVEGRVESTTVQTFHQRKDGSTYEAEIVLRYFPSAERPFFVANVTDVTERSHLQALLQRHSLYDPVTMLPNRALLLQRLGQASASADRAAGTGAVLVFGLESGKVIAESLGPSAGDAVITEAAERLSGLVRARDVVARIKDSDFAVLAPGFRFPHEAGTLAERLLRELRAPFGVGAYRFLIPCHAGISVFPQDGTDPEVLLRNAGTALRKAREDDLAGYHFYTHSLNETVSARLAMESALARALDRDEFSLVYQPKLDLAAGTVTGVEALLRWDSAELGPIPPAEFIPLLENSGMIGPVGTWIFETACRDRRHLRDAGFAGLTIAINLSMRQVAPTLITTFALLMARNGLAPSEFELELTESTLMRDPETSVSILSALAETGVRLSVDDFGCGYSSLSYLRRFPLSAIKIDRSFIQDLPESADAAAIVQAIVGMARALGLRLVAEGVETAPQFAYVRQVGCHEMQGYLLSRPLPLDRLMAFLRNPPLPDPHLMLPP